jgi:hypothetical protein
MKNILTILFLLIAFEMSAQVDISNTATNTAVELNVVSPNNNTGVLIPRLSTLEMTSIVSPTNGLLIYNSEVGAFMYNAGTSGTPIWAVVGQAPAMDIATISAVGNQGFILFNTTDSKIYYSNGATWVELLAP